MTMIMLQNLFAEDVTIDNRIPIFSFTLPNVFEPMLMGGSYGLLAPKPSFFMQVFLITFIPTIFVMVVAAVMYYFVISRTTTKNETSGTGPTSTTSSSLLITYGVIVPILAIEPYWLFKCINVRSQVLKMMIISPMSVTLRCLEACHGFTPSGAKQNLSNFITYTSCLVSNNTIDARTGQQVKTTRLYLYKKLQDFVRMYLALAVLLSILAPLDYKPFEKQREHLDDFKILDFFSFYRLLANFILAVTNSVTLDQSTTVISLVYSTLTSVQTDKVVLNPMFKSESPSHFWGRRWNTTAHEGLKGGIYKPMRNHGFSRGAAVVATFLVSGLIHEYVISFFYQDSSLSPSYGKNMLFFGWNGLLVMMESFLLSFPSFQSSWVMKQIHSLPSAFITFFVILTALPVAHLFIDDWVEVGFYHHLQVGYPLLLRLEK